MTYDGDDLNHGFGCLCNAAVVLFAAPELTTAVPGGSARTSCVRFSEEGTGDEEARRGEPAPSSALSTLLAASKTARLISLRLLDGEDMSFRRIRRIPGLNPR